MELKEGLYRIDPKTYHALPIISYTGVKEFQKSPAHYKAMLDGEKNETQAMVFGGAYHCFLLENNLFASQYAVKPAGMNARTKEGQAWMEQHKDKAIISNDEMEKIRAMAKVLWAHPQWDVFQRGAERETSMIWKDPIHEVWCRTRIDLLSTVLRLPVDLKSTTDASPRAFLKASFNLGYHIQAAWTIRGLKQITKLHHETFVFIAQEKTEPYAINVFEAQPLFIEAGHRIIDEVLPRYKACLALDQWPSYDPAVKPLDLPDWAMEETDGKTGDIVADSDETEGTKESV
jgi:exodeoxyribonuclease VIII